VAGWAGLELATSSLSNRPDVSQTAKLAPRGDADLVAAAIGCRVADSGRLSAFLEGCPVVDLPATEVRRAARQRGLPPRQVRRLLALREIVLRWQRPADSAAPAVTSPREALLQFQDLRRDGKERFSVLMLNSRNQPLACETVALGGLNIAALQPRDVFEPALRHNAAAVILAHSHPSGDPTPSPEDLAVTRHLGEAGRLLGVEVLDHLVISAERFRSLREGGGW
jgi:DNA repair protein RadC